MAMLQSGPINTNEYERSAPQSTPLPPGIYKGIVTKTDQSPTKSKDGNPPGVMVTVEFDITYPEEFANSNRKFWDRFNIVNANPTTVRIANEQIADLGKACGYEVVEDDEQFLGMEVQMQLAIEPAKEYTDKNGVVQKGTAKNKCVKYYHVDANVEEVNKSAKAKQQAAPAAPATQKQGWTKPAQPAASGVAPAQPVASGGAAPWKRK